MYLLDTNIWLELLLAQNKSDDVRGLLNEVSTDELYISDFSFHSICVILSRLNRSKVLVEFAQDLFVDGSVVLVSVRAEDISEVVSIMESFNLDFDDAYQYVVAEQKDLILVSFDSDFDHSSRGRKTPTEILSAL